MRKVTVHFTFEYDPGSPPGFGDVLYIVEQALEKRFTTLVEDSGIHPQKVEVLYSTSMAK